MVSFLRAGKANQWLVVECGRVERDCMVVIITHVGAEFIHIGSTTITQLDVSWLKP